MKVTYHLSWFHFVGREWEVERKSVCMVRNFHVNKFWFIFNIKMKDVIQSKQQNTSQILINISRFYFISLAFANSFHLSLSFSFLSPWICAVNCMNHQCLFVYIIHLNCSFPLKTAKINSDHKKTYDIC